MRSDQWLKIWDTKGHDYSFNEKDIHHADGFDMINKDEWDEMVYSFSDRLDLKEEFTVLEVGCGAGAFLDSIKRKYCQVDLYGFDISKNLISVANERVKGYFFTKNASDDYWELYFNFDLIISFSVFHYFDDLLCSKKILENMLNHLKDDGKILVGDIPDQVKESEDKK